ncbi:MAG: hypothetical protein KKG99_14505 [Bacteroidetes bacterium]|nr:hypothetical protein [Bacteroidota bacterium]
MNTINDSRMKKIAIDIFEVSKLFPGKIKVKQMEEPVPKEEIMIDFDCDFEAEYQIDNQAVIEKIKEIAKRGYDDHVIVIANKQELKYELYSHSGSNYSKSSATSTYSKSSGNSGGCFIATAVYGTPYANEVIILKEFRDNWLLNFRFGKIFIKFYYLISPPIANKISKSKLLKTFTKITLIIPVIKIAKHFKRK